MNSPKLIQVDNNKSIRILEAGKSLKLVNLWKQSWTYVGFDVSCRLLAGEIYLIFEVR